jgi:hypothetical protein
MMANKSFEVHACWDDEARVWYVSESDVPGLSAEAETTEELLAKLRVIIPELVMMNSHLIDFEPGADLPIHLMAERLENLRCLS